METSTLSSLLEAWNQARVKFKAFSMLEAWVVQRVFKPALPDTTKEKKNKDHVN